MVADPYQVLGVSHSATEDEIRQAYRRLAKKYHPDLNPGDAQAAQKMNEVNEAYDLLKNPQAYQQQRAQQDHTGKAEDHDLEGCQMAFQMETCLLYTSPSPRDTR